MNDVKFCPRCDYATDRVTIGLARYDYVCPRCGKATISEFYAYGSATHRARREAWERGGLSVYGVIPTGAPLPYKGTRND